MTAPEQTCYISLGGNQGDVASVFSQALKQLGNTPSIRVGKISRCYRTAPVGSEAGSEYLNAAAELITPLAPMKLLQSLQTVETEFGRIRPYHWAPRTLDLDLIFYGEQIIQSEELTVPHPAAWYRRFVLVPLVEIAPHLVHPVQKLTVTELLESVRSVPYRVSIQDCTENQLRAWNKVLLTQFPDIEMHGQTDFTCEMQINLATPKEKDSRPTLTLDFSQFSDQMILQRLTDVLMSVQGDVKPV